MKGLKEKMHGFHLKSLGQIVKSSEPPKLTSHVPKNGCFSQKYKSGFLKEPTLKNNAEIEVLTGFPGHLYYCNYA